MAEPKGPGKFFSVHPVHHCIASAVASLLTLAKIQARCPLTPQIWWSEFPLFPAKQINFSYLCFH